MVVPHPNGGGGGWIFLGDNIIGERSIIEKSEYVVLVINYLKKRRVGVFAMEYMGIRILSI